MSLEITALGGIPELTAGDDLACLIVEAGEAPNGTGLEQHDCLVVTQKAVSKVEGRIVPIDPNDPLGHRRWVEQESQRIIRRRGELVISETAHGFVCANAGVDLSNVASGQAALLPVDPDRSARRIRDSILALRGVEVAVVISDTFGRPWRRGVCDVAIGCAGITALLDLRGTSDALGRQLMVTEVALVDEICAAAELVMGKSLGLPVALLRGLDPEWFRASGARGSEVRNSGVRSRGVRSWGVQSEIVRSPADDLFR